jgi:hypothetical protein
MGCTFILALVWWIVATKPFTKNEVCMLCKWIFHILVGMVGILASFMAWSVSIITTLDAWDVYKGRTIPEGSVSSWFVGTCFMVTFLELGASVYYYRTLLFKREMGIVLGIFAFSFLIAVNV